MKLPDVDIDLRPGTDILDHFPTAIRASRVEKDTLKKHQVGVYLQNIPVDNISGLSAIPYKQAADCGYFKFDFLNLSMLEKFESKQEIRELVKHDPDWRLLEDGDMVKQLSQIHRHFDIVNQIKPTSVQELADTISLIRPAKRYLMRAYIANKELIREEIYKVPDDPKKYYYKRPHALAYALTIVLQLHYLKFNMIE